MLKVENLCFKYKGKSGRGFSLNDVSFELEDGYFMTLIGDNGAGKTSLLDLIYNVYKPHSGQVKWDDRIISDNNLDFTWRQEVAYLSGEIGLHVDRSIEDNVSLLKLLYPKFDLTFFSSILSRIDWDMANNGKALSELSDGQLVQVLLAFNLAKKPRLILMDEPFAFLDPVVKTDVVEIIMEYVREENASVIISTHLVDEISDMTDYIGFVKSGKLVEFGDRETIFEKYNSNSLKELIYEGIC